MEPTNRGVTEKKPIVIGATEGSATSFNKRGFDKVAFVVTSTASAKTLAVLGSHDNATFYPLYSGGSAYTITATNGRGYAMDAAVVGPWNYIKMTSDADYNADVVCAA